VSIIKESVRLATLLLAFFLLPAVTRALYAGGMQADMNSPKKAFFTSALAGCTNIVFIFNQHNIILNDCVWLHIGLLLPTLILKIISYAFTVLNWGRKTIWQGLHFCAVFLDFMADTF
jgi:hypothetical protein